jgi:putative NIF3 family GTP cyclohydrolase 1 type 2
MSKRDLKKYIGQLTKEQLEEQILELYDKFNPVKVFYNFVFNPKEALLLREAKTKIAQEYFPVAKSGAKRLAKAKLRRSVAQKYCKHFLTLGVDPFITADLMLYGIEIAQTYTAENNIISEAFYKSIYNSYEQVVSFCISNGIYFDFKNRIEGILTETKIQKWKNCTYFENLIQKNTQL